MVGIVRTYTTQLILYHYKPGSRPEHAIGCLCGAIVTMQGDTPPVHVCDGGNVSRRAAYESGPFLAHDCHFCYVLTGTIAYWV